MELTANPTSSFTGSVNDRLFKLNLTFASSLPANTYYVGYCLEKGAQTGCVNGSAIVDQATYPSGATLGTNGLTSSSVSLGSTPYLLEIYH
ncbi:MAG TPA: hypothetical protein VMG98_01240 [Verrucomicrobiae bacterium]|nr:hypothetical protein [Verrucomicrobiae bacterium]